jgi:hypothetical protein
MHAMMLARNKCQAVPNLKKDPMSHLHVMDFCNLSSPSLVRIEGSKETQPISILQKINKNRNDIFLIFRSNKWHIAKWLCSLEVFFPLSFVVSKV